MPTQVANGRKILDLASSLGNSQLRGLGHEVLALAVLGSDQDQALYRAKAAGRNTYRVADGGAAPTTVPA